MPDSSLNNRPYIMPRAIPEPDAYGQPLLPIVMSAIETSGQAMFVFDNQGRISYTNQTAASLTGYSKQELLSKEIFDLIPELSDKGSLPGWQQLVYDYGGVTLEVMLHTAIGIQRPIELNATSFLHEDGVSSCAFARDLATDLDAVSTMIDEQTAHMKQQLQNRAIELEVSNRELEEFVSVVSHDLRAPLRGIVNHARFLEEDFTEALDEKGKDYLATIRDNAAHMDQLITDLLQYARIGKTNSMSDDVDVNAVLTQLIKSLPGHADAEIKLPSVATVVNTNEILFRQIMTNLLSNAVKFVPATRKPEVEIRVMEGDFAWQFYVIDNGIGIPESQRDRVFGVFERLHADSEFPGTGMGLAIIKKSLDALGGEIEISSIVDEGTTFSFSIPKPMD